MVHVWGMGITGSNTDPPSRGVVENFPFNLKKKKLKKSGFLNISLIQKLPFY